MTLGADWAGLTPAAKRRKFDQIGETLEKFEGRETCDLN
jgi:hypothetical protein